MNDTLKAAGRIGAELGAAKAENEKLRGLLREAHDTIRNLADDLDEEEFQAIIDQLAEIELALAQQQTEPCQAQNGPCPGDGVGECKHCPTAVDMATAAAQGFRDGQAAVEQAPAQGELWAVHAQGPDELYAAFSRADAEQHAAALNALPMPDDIHVSAVVIVSPWSAAEHWKYLAEQEREHATDLRAIATRPAQTEQQPVAWLIDWPEEPELGHYFSDEPNEHARSRPLYAAPIAQTDQQPDCDWCAGAGHDPYGHPCQHCKRSDLFTTFAMHQRVRKTSGSEWQGRICGRSCPVMTVESHLAALSAVTAERDRLRDQVKVLQSVANSWQSGYDRGRHDGTKHRHSEVHQLRAEVEMLREDAERWRYVSLQGDDTHWLNLLRVDLEDFGGNINAAVDALIDGDTPVTAAKEA
jgi:hypothetical protein